MVIEGANYFTVVGDKSIIYCVCLGGTHSKRVLEDYFGEPVKVDEYVVDKGSRIKDLAGVGLMIEDVKDKVVRMYHYDYAYHAENGPCIVQGTEEEETVDGKRVGDVDISIMVYSTDHREVNLVAENLKRVLNGMKLNYNVDEDLVKTMLTLYALHDLEDASFLERIDYL